MRARTVGELRQSGWQTKSVKQELRDNLIARLQRNEPIFPGIVGYDESVVPQVENAILSGQDIVFLGEPRYHVPLYPAFALAAAAGVAFVGGALRAGAR